MDEIKNSVSDEKDGRGRAENVRSEEKVRGEECIRGEEEAKREGHVRREGCIRRCGNKRRTLAGKFILGAALILGLSFGLCAAANSGFAWRYCLHRQAEDIREAGERLTGFLDGGMEPGEAVLALEEERKVLAVYAYLTGDSEALSNELRDKFRQRGLGFEKFWLWEGDYARLLEDGSRLQLYRQERLNYGILTEYLTWGDYIFAVAAIVPDIGEAVEIINGTLFIIGGGFLLLSVILIAVLVKKITSPLRQMEEFSERLARREYGTLEIRTNDELETVAESMNAMSRSIQEYQAALLARNRQMEELLNNVAHDLKTPISLVGMYAAGIRDGLDDGTFLDTIIRQNKRMASLTEQLLSLSRIRQKKYPEEREDLSALLREQTAGFEALAAGEGLSISAEIEPGAEICGNRELIEAVFSNLLSNAVKYAAGGEIRVSLRREEEAGGRPVFTVENETGEKRIDTERIWEPFYVGEVSRNSSLSGTGLGLPIVRQIAAKCGYTISCIQNAGTITFRVEF